MSFTNSLPKRKHSQTSFYLKTVHAQPSPLKLYENDNLQNLVRMQQKEIDRLEHQNRNLQILADQQSKIIYQERQSRAATLVQDKKEQLTISKTSQLKQRIEGKIERPIRLQRKNTITRRLTMLFQQDDTFKLSNVLDLATPEEHLLGTYDNDGSLQLIQETLNDEDCFLDLIHNYPPQKVSIIYDKLKKIFQEHGTMFRIILKLKELITKGFAMQSSKLLDESFEILRESTLRIMECQEVKVYLMDEEKKELYSRQDNQKYQIGEGLVGFVADSKQILNLKKAKYDQRFQAGGNVVMAVPIMDNQKCYGVMVCYEKSANRIFTEEDEAILQLLSEQGRMIMSNVMNHNQLVLAVNKFRHTLRSSVQFIQAKSSNQLVEVAQQRLKQMMNSEGATIKLESQVQGLGIMGKVISNRTISCYSNSYNSPYFHPNVDINTQLPIVAVPIICNGIVIGCAEYTQMRVQQSSLSSIEQEVLEMFMQAFGQCMIKL